MRVTRIPRSYHKTPLLSSTLPMLKPTNIQPSGLLTLSFYSRKTSLMRSSGKSFEGSLRMWQWGMNPPKSLPSSRACLQPKRMAHSFELFKNGSPTSLTQSISSFTKFGPWRTESLSTQTRWWSYAPTSAPFYKTILQQWQAGSTPCIWTTFEQHRAPLTKLTLFSWWIRSSSKRTSNPLKLLCKHSNHDRRLDLSNDTPTANVATTTRLMGTKCNGTHNSNAMITIAAPGLLFARMKTNDGGTTTNEAGAAAAAGPTTEPATERKSQRMAPTVLKHMASYYQ